MFRKLSSVLFLALLVFMLVGCEAHTHIVGTGPAGSDVLIKRQWYALWGLVPINQVDTGAMAAGATNYSIHTEMNFLDVVMNIFTGYVTIYSRTVTVKK
jgi:hypothetical protein